MNKYLDIEAWNKSMIFAEIIVLSLSLSKEVKAMFQLRYQFKTVA